VFLLDFISTATAWVFIHVISMNKEF